MNRAAYVLSSLALVITFLVTPIAAPVAHAGAEPVLEARIPDNALNYTLRHLLVTRDSVIKRLDDVLLSPVDGSISITGQIELPTGLIHSMEERAGGESVPQTHDFQLTI